MRCLIPVSIIVSLLALPIPAWSWGKTGHRVGGAIAEDFLTDEARAAVTELLGVETLAEASIWADFMRSSDEQFWASLAGPWHYVTVPDGQTYADVGAPPEGDAVAALARFADLLRDPEASVSDKQRALRFAIHIVGDLHQPLHVGNGTDRGGNDVEIKFFNRMTRLHTIWDTHLVDHQQLSYTEMAEGLRRRITPELAAEWDDPDPATWVSESAALRPGVYPGEHRKNLRFNYVFDHQATVNLRLSQSGVRMASWLNAVYESEE